MLKLVNNAIVFENGDSLAVVDYVGSYIRLNINSDELLNCEEVQNLIDILKEIKEVM